MNTTMNIEVDIGYLFRRCISRVQTVRQVEGGEDACDALNAIAGLFSQMSY